MFEADTDLAGTLRMAEKEGDVAVGCAFAWRDELYGGIDGIVPPLGFFGTRHDFELDALGVAVFTCCRLNLF